MLTQVNAARPAWCMCRNIRGHHAGNVHAGQFDPSGGELATHGDCARFRLPEPASAERRCEPMQRRSIGSGHAGCQDRAGEAAMKNLRRFLPFVAALIAAFTCLLSTPSAVEAASAQRGLTFARLHCAQCHSLDKLTASPLRAAPPFRELHKRYPVETLEEAFAEGIVTGHPSMPEFRLDPDQIGDLIAFMKTLE
jgi:cytochrome c